MALLFGVEHAAISIGVKSFPHALASCLCVRGTEVVFSSSWMAPFLEIYASESNSFGSFFHRSASARPRLAKNYPPRIVSAIMFSAAMSTIVPRIMKGFLLVIEILNIHQHKRWSSFIDFFLERRATHFYLANFKHVKLFRRSTAVRTSHISGLHHVVHSEAIVQRIRHKFHCAAVHCYLLKRCFREQDEIFCDLSVSSSFVERRADSHSTSMK